MKLPFVVHPALTALGSLDADGPRCVAAAPTGDRFAYSVGGEVCVVGVDGAVVSRFARDDVRGLAFSPDGQRLGLVDVRFVPPNRHAATIEIVDVGGGVVSRGDLPAWGEVSHGSYGGKAPSLVFHPDGRRVYVRSALMGDSDSNSVAVLDVDGGLRVRELPPSSNHVFSLCLSKNRLFVQFSQAGEESGLCWLDPDSLDELGRNGWAAGEVVVDGARGVWSVGHRSWLWRNDVDDTAVVAPRTLAAGWEQSHQIAVARAKEVAARAGGKNKGSIDDGHFNYWVKGGGIRVADKPATDVLGARSYRTTGPAPAAGAIAAGDDDVIVCDGISLDLLREQDGGLRVVHLIDDPRSNSAYNGRLQHVAGAADLVVVGWKKSRNAPVTLTALRLDLAQLDAAPTAAPKKKTAPKKKAAPTEKAAPKKAAAKKAAPKKTAKPARRR